VQWKRIEPSLFGTDYAEAVPDYTPALRVAVHRARSRLRDMIASEAGVGAGSEQGKTALFQALTAHNQSCQNLRLARGPALEHFK
jgi:hypothetical protein